MWVKWAWATSSYSWNSERGQRYTWATAGYNAHEYEADESIITVDSVAKSLAKTIADNITQSEGLDIGKFYTFNEALNFRDTVSFVVRKKINEETITSDSITRQSNFNRVENESINLESCRFSTENKVCSDNLALLENNIFNRAFCINDSISVADTKQASLSREFSQSISLLDSKIIDSSINKNESFGVIDSKASSIGLNKTDTITTIEQLRFDTDILRAENINIADIKEGSFSRSFENYFSISEESNRDIGYYKNETIAVNEVLEKVAQFARECQETISIADLKLGNFTTTKEEQFGITEELDRVIIVMFQGTIGDLYAVDSYMTVDNFTKFVGRPLDYEEFFEFITGEYEYKEAKIKIDLVAESAQAQPTISGTTMMVDIDDTNDRGTASIYATDTNGTEVVMNKVFYHVPEIQVTLLGATGYGMPNVITNDSWVGSDGIRYFKVKIFDSTGTMINGQISWVAKGY